MKICILHSDYVERLVTCSCSLYVPVAQEKKYIFVAHVPFVLLIYFLN